MSTRAALLALLTPDTPEAHSFADALERALEFAADDIAETAKYAFNDEDREEYALRGAVYSAALDSLMRALAATRPEASHVYP